MKLAALIALLALSVAVPAKDYYDETRDSQKIAWMDLGMELIEAKLKDPGSAEFRNVYFNYSLLPATCGEVNSKNSLGGYQGFQRFIATGESGITVLEEQVSDFSALWERLCE